MPQDKIYSVAALGLEQNEVRFIKIMLALTSHASTSRVQGRYQWTENSSSADIVIVDANDNTAVKMWHELADKFPSKKLLLVADDDQACFTKYFFLRPFGPSKVLMLLDKMVKDEREHRPEVKIFSSAAKTAQREFFRPGQDVIPARHRALVIDDSATVRKLLVLELGCFNIKVDTAETGEQGLELLETNRYDIIFLDVVMPGMGGYQVCKSIRKNQATKLTPIIMLTSKSSPIDRVRGSLAGCSSYLTKPVDHENFYQVLEGYLAEAKAVEDSSKKCA